VIRFLIVTSTLFGAFTANSQERCPELAQLKAAADAALKKTDGLEGQSRCSAFIQYSSACFELDKYAHDHSDDCSISTVSLNDITERHKNAVKVRVDACWDGGLRQPALPPKRPRMPTFPPEVRPK
jgi:hypothetical protein